MSNGLLTKWRSTNKPYKRIFASYFKTTTKYELITDIGMPLLIAVIFYTFTIKYWPSYLAFHQFAAALDPVVIYVLTVLAGFNVAAVAMIGSSQGRIITKLSEMKDADDRSQLEGVLSMFCWAIFLQLALLIACLVYYVLDGLLIDPQTNYLIIHNWWVPKLYVLTTAVALGLFLTLHAIFLSIRNVAGLFLLVMNFLHDKQ